MKFNYIALFTYIIINTLLVSVILQIYPETNNEVLMMFSVFTALFWPESFIIMENKDGIK